MKGTWDHFVVSLQLPVNLYLFQKMLKVIEIIRSFQMLIILSLILMNFLLIDFLKITKKIYLEQRSVTLKHCRYF